MQSRPVVDLNLTVVPANAPKHPLNWSEQYALSVQHPSREGYFDYGPTATWSEILTEIVQRVCILFELILRSTIHKKG